MTVVLAATYLVKTKAEETSAGEVHGQWCGQIKLVGWTNWTALGAARALDEWLIIIGHKLVTVE